MSNIEINRKNIADMLLGLYEKEPFSMNTNVEKDSISEEFFQEEFTAWKTEIFEKAEQLDTMERIRNQKNAETI